MQSGNDSNGLVVRLKLSKKPCLLIKLHKLHNAYIPESLFIPLQSLAVLSMTNTIKFLPTAHLCRVYVPPLAASWKYSER